MATRAATFRFSTLGLISVATLLATGIVNGWILVGNPNFLTSTFYGQLLLAKVGLFAVMVIIAVLNRLRLSEFLPDSNAAGRLARNALAELSFGFVILAVIGELGTLPPAAHEEIHDAPAHLHEARQRHERIANSAMSGQGVPRFPETLIRPPMLR
jgi:copper resistance protein D